jgi:hypothetical protein
MATASINVIRRDLDATLSVYRGQHWCGMVFCPTQGAPSDYLASAWTDAVPQQSFTAEADAVDYLVREG